MDIPKKVVFSMIWSLLVLGFATGQHRVHRDVNNKQIDDIIPTIGPRQEADFVVIMDRSRGMEMDNFYLKEKRILKQILQNYVTISSQYVRVACLTFGSDVEVVFDSISWNTDSINKGHIFSGNSPLWDGVQYYFETSRFVETNLEAALEQGRIILAEGRERRNGVPQIVLVSTDGDYREFDDTVAQADQLKRDDGVIIFGLGVGPWIEGNAGNVQAIVSRPEYYALYNTWVQMLSEQPTSYSYDTTPDPSLYEEMPTNDGYCEGSCHANSQCFVDIDTGFEQCLCVAGYTSDNDALVQPACRPCPFHSYKDEPGNVECRYCPPPTFTNQTGSTSISVCQCPIDVINAGDEHIDCIDQCDGACGQNQRCLYTGTRNRRCECGDGWFNTAPGNSDQIECIQSVNDCVNSPCFGQATCVDLDSDFLCLCPIGFTGRNCEIEEDPCDHQLCLNGGTCSSDGPSSWSCQCPYGWGERYCGIVSTTTRSSSSTTTPFTSTAIDISTTQFPTTNNIDSTTTSSFSSSTPQQSDAGKSSEDNASTAYIATGAVAAVAGLLLIGLIIVTILYVNKRPRRIESKRSPHNYRQDYENTTSPVEAPHESIQTTNGHGNASEDYENTSQAEGPYERIRRPNEHDNTGRRRIESTVPSQNYGEDYENPTPSEAPYESI